MHNFTPSNLFLPRILAILAVFALVPLLFPYKVPVFLAMCFALLTMPFFLKLNKKYKPVKSILAYTASLVFALVIPISLTIVMVVPQVINGVRLIQSWYAADWAISPELRTQIEEIHAWLIQIPQVEGWLIELESDFASMLNTIVPTLLSGSINIAGSVMSFGWSIFLFVILTLLFLVYADPIKIMSERILNLGDNIFERFILAIRNALRSVVLGILLVALLQGIVCTIGFILFKVPEPLFWGLLACLVAPIPIIGTFFVWGPLAVYLWFVVSPTMSLALVAWGMLAVAAVDNFTRPYFLSTGIKAPFFVLFLSLLCGLGVFGAVGLILGPVLLAFSLQCASEISRILDIEIPKIRPPKKTKKIKLINKS